MLTFDKSLYLTFRVQSDTKSVDFIESKMNTFLASLADWKPTDQQIKKTKETLISSFTQKDANLSKEASRHWNSIQDGTYDFDVNKKKIELC